MLAHGRDAVLELVLRARDEVLDPRLVVGARRVEQEAGVPVREGHVGQGLVVVALGAARVEVELAGGVHLEGSERVDAHECAFGDRRGGLVQGLRDEAAEKALQGRHVRLARLAVPLARFLR